MGKRASLAKKSYVESIHFQLERCLSPSRKWPGITNSQVCKQTRIKRKENVLQVLLAAHTAENIMVPL